MRNQTRIFILLAVIAVFVGCNSYYDKTGGRQADMAPMSASQYKEFCFDLVFSQVIAPRCLECHQTAKNKQPALTSYANLMPLLKVNDPAHSDLYTSLQGAGGDMPKNHPALGPNQLKLMAMWIASGAPEAEGMGHMPINMPTDTTPPPPIQITDIQPTYSSLNEKVFKKYCIDCHQPHPDKPNKDDQGPSGDFDLTSYATMMASVDSDTGIPMITKDDAVDSELYDVMNKGTMPRPKSDPRLSANVANAILAWIKAGALNN